MKTTKLFLNIKVLFIIFSAILIIATVFLLSLILSAKIAYAPLIAPQADIGNTEPTLPPSESDAVPNAPLPERIYYSVSFTAQAPFGDWDDVKQDYGCEEASLLMAMAWVNDKTITPAEARDEIVAMSEFQLENYNHHHDTSIADTLKLLNDYFGYTRAFTRYDIGLDDVKNELADGNLVIIPIDGSRVNNPFYTPPGPFRHQVLVIGYDEKERVLITHDPGTRQGAAYEYDYDTISEAIIDYESGLNEPIIEKRTAILVIRPKID